jgi:hypothetical protein
LNSGKSSISLPLKHLLREEYGCVRLNHSGGHKRGTAGVYNRASYDREKRRALETWAEHVLALVEGRESKL